MYIPKINQLKDHKQIFKFVTTNSFGILVNNAENLPIATHIPMDLSERKDGQWLIQCHIAKANPQWKSLEKNNQSLCIFTGPHAYISSSWYTSVNVPTWNYMAVHLYGKARILKASELKTLLKQQIDTYESNSENPTKMADYETGFIDRLTRAVVGIEIIVEDIQAKYKLSQNKNEHEVNNLIGHLEKSDDPNAINIAKEMKKLKK